MPLDTEEAGEEATTRLLASRRAHRGQMTKLLKKAKDMTQDKEMADLSADDKTTLSGLVHTMHTKLTTLKDLDTKITDLTKVDELETVIVEADDYIQQQHADVYKLQAFITPSASAQIPTAGGHNDSLLWNFSQSIPTKRNVNLPKLKLPTFDGDILKWLPYFDSFCAAVHNDDNLDNIQKFQYLLSSLSGEAARAIDGLPLTNNNYDEALDVLKDRYGQTHKIISGYMKALWELPKLSDISCMKTFYDKLETYIRGLKSLGKTEDTYGDLLVPIILDKIPNSVKTQISRTHGDKAWSLADLRAAINTEIQAFEAGYMAIESDPMQSITSSAAALHIGSRPQSANNNRGNVPKPPCAFCKDSHAPITCVKVVDKTKRYDIVKRDRLCFNCLKGNHRIADCPSKGRCKNCRKKHHTALCPNEVNQNTTPGVRTPAANVSSEDTHVKLIPAGSLPSGPVLLKTASAKLWHNGVAVTANILLDEGAQRTFVTSETAQRLYVQQEQCGNEHINLATFGDRSTQGRTLHVTQLQLEVNSGEKLDISALIVPKISSPVRNYLQASIHEHKYLQDLPLAQHVEMDTFDIDLLVGADFYWSIVGDHIVRGPGPTAVSSKLGYLISGPSQLPNTSVMNTIVCKVHTEDLDTMLPDMWKLETIGIMDDANSQSCDYEQYHANHLQFKDGKYTASLPWRGEHDELPTNYGICLRRTRAMVKRLSPEVRDTYDKIISDQESRGFIEPVTQDDTSSGHYIPHHPVYKNSETTPIRIVYDCSCRIGDGPSLNDCLDTGPCLINNLVEILLRFRLHAFALVSDIEKAFLNIQLAEHDRQYTKFLWLSDPGDPQSDFKVFQFKSVLFGAVSSPFILNAVVKSLLERTPNKITEDLLNNIYVDNVITGTDTEDNALTYYKEARSVLASAGFNLRSWNTNSALLWAVIETDNNHDPNSSPKVLGMHWDRATDCLIYPKVPSCQQTVRYTKRTVLKHVSTLFDPLGFLSPVLIRAKMFVQSLWAKELQWDMPLPEDLIDEWKTIFPELDAARDARLSRKYFPVFQKEADQTFELHIFSDASLKAYGAVVYLKHDKKTAFVMAKSRVKPLKEVTLPRLELLGTVIGAQVANLVTSALDTRMNKVVLWTDSQIVLHWIHSTKKLPVFIDNRLKTIRAAPFTEYKYCPTLENPADLLTRGITYDELSTSNLWTHGPHWLPDGDWPVCIQFDHAILLNQTDYTSTDNKGEDETSSKEDKPPSQDLSISNVIDRCAYNSMAKLFRVTCYVLRFIKRVRQAGDNPSPPNHLTLQELNQAQTLWIQAVQQLAYPNEYAQLKVGLKSKCPLVRQLKLFLDKQDLIRCGGRLQHGNIHPDMKYPILLPPRDHLTRLLVVQTHTQTSHMGSETTITQIRKHFWIPKIRQVVKPVLRMCVTCRRWTGRPYRPPETPPLPSFRLTECPAFSVCGVDFTGVLYYKSTTSRLNKAYVCLFTCAVSRAVHLEIVTDMTTDGFLRAFRRFVARHSLPRKMISDNGLTFVAGAEVIKKICEDRDVKSYLAEHRVEWTFIPKRAPWFGGFYERLIGLTKNALKKTLGHTTVSLDELITIISEIEAMINERPLTYVCNDTSDPTPLTPSMLVHGHQLTLLPHFTVNEEDLSDPDYIQGSRIALTERAKRIDMLFRQCWQRWRCEYLPHLREAHIANQRKEGRTSPENIITVGDVVLVHGDDNRSQWRLAIVTKLHKGADGFIRSASIKTKHGVTNRPITKLYPLEVNAETLCSQGENASNADLVPPRLDKPKRQAAIKAAEIVKKWTDELSH